jgi:Tannase and feruloyl esterase
MGHPITVGYDASWAYGKPTKIIDWAYQANHVTAGVAKTIIKAFYGNGPKLSYFTGCSDGGHEALMEAQRFPDDYDGIIGGALANNWSLQSAAHIWQARALINSALPTSKFPLIHNAALAACDALDGIIENPLRCNFDPRVLQCDGADGPNCLTAAQVDAVRKMYSGPVNPRTGAPIYPGEEPGSELGWSFTLPPTPGGIGREFYKYFVYQNPNWDMNTLDFDYDVTYGQAVGGPIVDSTNPDLRAFEERGGKFIMYHGWADQAINPRNSANYFESVARSITPANRSDQAPLSPSQIKQTQQFLRLFFIPGMPHCLGGPGVDTFDALSALENWVERGIAPDEIIGSHTGASIGPNIMTAPPPGSSFTRPLCPYPQVAHYNGRGSTSDASNFSCGNSQSDDAGD